jgi:hypothetical protein
MSEVDKRTIDNFIKILIDNATSSFLSVIDGIGDVPRMAGLNSFMLKMEHPYS